MLTAKERMCRRQIIIASFFLGGGGGDSIDVTRPITYLQTVINLRDLVNTLP